MIEAMILTHDVDDLRMQTWFDFDQNTTHATTDQWHDHLRSCVPAGSEHFEHML